MPTPEVHNIKHEIIDGKIVVIENDVREIANRVVKLEGSDLVLNEQMKNTISSINSLINWIKWALGIGIAAYVSFFAWLMQQQIK